MRKFGALFLTVIFCSVGAASAFGANVPNLKLGKPAHTFDTTQKESDKTTGLTETYYLKCNQWFYSNGVVSECSIYKESIS